MNLVDYYIVRRGHYAIAEIFNPDGIYGRWGWRGHRRLPRSASPPWCRSSTSSRDGLYIGFGRQGPERRRHLVLHRPAGRRHRSTGCSAAASTSRPSARRRRAEADELEQAAAHAHRRTVTDAAPTRRLGDRGGDPPRRASRAVDVVERALDRIAADPTAPSRVSPRDARRWRRRARSTPGARRGPLAGVPVVGQGPRLAGRAAGHQRLAGPCADFVARRVRGRAWRGCVDAGAVVVGKTNNPEFCYRGITDNELFGVTRNPRDPARTAGGSSGGAAASVAAGVVPLAVGTDGGGSIRIPSAFCGTLGLKPSLRRSCRRCPASAAGRRSR